MGFVFYDTETTGVHTRFDQILQFAAIRTDDQLVELDRFEIRCRLQPHIIPHPGALAVTGMTIEQLIHDGLVGHYEMIRQIRDRMLGWSPAIFVGYNSLSFDEELLRSALFQTLHDPYLTNKNGNCRADALSLVRLASVYAPECLTVPCDHKGAAVFKLDQLAPANGFNHANAHDALADVEATIHLARCVMERAPECWSRFVRFASKPATIAFIDDEDAFVLTEFYFNRAYHFVVTPIGQDATNPAVYHCLDLRHDPAALQGLSDAALRTFLRKSPKPVRTVKAHKAPPIASIDDCPESVRSNVDDQTLEHRLAYLAEHPELRERLLEALLAEAPEYEDSEHCEEQIYSGFPSNDDQRLMEQFHQATWEARPAIVTSFTDERLRYFGQRLIYQHRPDLLDEPSRAAIIAHHRERWWTDHGTAKRWTTLPQAKAAIAEMMVTTDETGRLMLKGLEAYFAKIAT